MKEQIGDQMEVVGIQPVYVSFETIEEIYRDVRIFGSLMNESEKSEAVIDFYTTNKNEIDNMVSSSQLSPKTLLIQITESEGGFVYSVPPASWLQTAMIEDLNGIAVWKTDAMSGGWMDVNVEQIIDWQPEMVLVINYQGQSPLIINKLHEDAVWKEFIETYKIQLKPFVYDFQSWDQPDSRWILGYASLAHSLHPEAVTSGVVYDLVRDFYQKMYGLSLKLINDEIIPGIESQIE